MRRIAFALIVASILSFTLQRATAIAPPYGEIVFNGGFEAGDLSHWSGASTGSVPSTVVLGNARSGSFSARTGQFLYTEQYQALPSVPYSVGAWYKTIFPRLPVGTLTVRLDWYDTSDARVGDTVIFTESNTPRGNWTYAYGLAISPANAAYFNAYFDYFGVLGSYIDLDDVSVMGPMVGRTALYLPLLAHP